MEQEPRRSPAGWSRSIGRRRVCERDRSRAVAVVRAAVELLDDAAGRDLLRESWSRPSRRCR